MLAKAAGPHLDKTYVSSLPCFFGNGGGTRYYSDFGGKRSSEIMLCRPATASIVLILVLLYIKFNN